MSSFLQNDNDDNNNELQYNNIYRVAIIGDQKTGKTEILKWFFEGRKNHGNIEYEEVLVGEFTREVDYVRIPGSLHRFQSSFETEKFKDYRKNKFKARHERKAILQRKKFNKRYRATVSPLFYDVVVGGDDDQDNSNNDNNGSSGNVKNKTAVQVWDTSGKSSFSRLGLIFEEFRLVDLFLLTFSIDDRATFDNVKKWKNDVINQLEHMGNHRKIPLILIGTKLDKEENRQVTQDRVYDYCRRKAPHGGNIPYFEVSSRIPAEGSSINEIFDEAVKLIEINRSIAEISMDDTGKHKPISQKQLRLIHTNYALKNGKDDMNRSCKACSVM